MAFLPLAMMAYDAEIDGIYYNVVKKARIATVTSGDVKYTGEVVIPETITFEGVECTVTSIGDNAFYDCDLTSVTFPETLTSIGSHAFEGARIRNQSVIIPPNVTTIGDYAFAWSTLRNVTLGESVTSIGVNAFRYNYVLTSINIPSSVTSIGGAAFAECWKLTSIYISDMTAWCNITIGVLYGVAGHPFEGTPDANHHIYLNGEEVKDLLVPNDVTSIHENTFKNCDGLTSVIIPPSVTSISDLAFDNCSGLTSVIIGKGVASIGMDAFRGCIGLSSIIVEEDNQVYDSRNGCNAIIETATNTLIKGCHSSLIPEGITSIGNYAFYGRTGLTSMTIPSSVTSIGNQSFANCENLAVVTCNATTVPSTNTNAFDGSYTEYATLIVPDEALSDYQTTAPWSNFGTILGSSQATVVTANSYSRKYGEPNPTFEYTCGITLNGKPSITCAATETSAPGVYPIVITQGTETNAGLIYVDGTLTITKAPLTITAKSYTVNAGDAMPNFEVEYRGFKNNETADDLTSQPTISCTASDTYTEGIYDITVSGAASDNYDISYVAGKLTVAPTDAHITITSAGMGTYCSPYDLDFTGVTALKAYTIAGYDKANSRVYAMRVYDVPAGTGLYLVGNPGDYDVPISTSNSYYINMLVGTLEQTWIDTTDGDLTNLRLTGTNPSNASFKILSEGRNFSANRAYLQIPTYILGNTANAATAFGIVLDDDTNGIEDIMLNSDDTDSEWYTLDGRKLNGKPTARGIYVVKGRKVVIK